jgi:hypothetical protein
MGEGARLVRRSLGEGGRTGLRRAEVASATQAGEGGFMGGGGCISHLLAYVCGIDCSRTPESITESRGGLAPAPA